MKIPVSSGQLSYERKHLLEKLSVRDPDTFRKLAATAKPDAHPFFVVRNGGIAEWERV
jgi:hypothetical protein